MAERTVADIERRHMTLDAAMRIAKMLDPGSDDHINCPRCKGIETLFIMHLPDGVTTGSCTHCDLDWMEGN